ncbi:glycosyltransferase family 4 protein [Desulfovibrio mangrovi]|uniref:glycosyltransferase family 4 protein n=1 Tax=Desulfovibrio mangrovi TaxID=2976983 RepID=UPI0022450DAB|nr:glycosyltransferase family 4 protein [Desulfovibrio mangrovi]UZP65938.1 glycosyltransferase family 4 protein [Desulfovibrio mangrovi]
MRILVFGSYAPSLINFRGPLLRAMLAAGHTVIAAAPDLDADTVRTLHAMGVEAAQVPLSRKGLNPLRDIAALMSLVKTIKGIAPDVMLSYTIKPVVYGSIAARLAGVPNIYAMVEGLGYAFNGKGLKRTVLAVIAGMLYAAGMSVCRSIFFLNEDNRGFFRKCRIISASRRTCLVNGTGIDLDHYGPAPLPEKYAEAPVFLCIARLLREKGVREFAEAARLVKQEFPQAVFRLVGPFDRGVDCVSEEEVAPWREWMDIPGPSADVRPDIAGCAVYVLPSYHEGVPRTTLEAMSMQRAIVTTDAVGCRETVREGRNGYMVPVGDAKALAEAMMRFIRQPERIVSMGAESRRYAEERFDVHKVNEAVLREMSLL